MADINVGRNTREETGCGTLTTSIFDDNTVYADIKKCGGCATAQAEAMSRLAGLCLRAGVNPQEISSQLVGIRCSSPHLEILSCADAFGKSMKKLTESKSEEK